MGAPAYRSWLWPHLLSLDAPLVAAAWQLLLARSVAPIPAVQTWVLALTVWLIYAVDRVLDGMRKSDGYEAPRHRFAREFRRPLLAAVVVVLAVDLTLAIGYLEPVRLERGLLLAGMVGVHFFFTHRRGGAFPKELWISLVFAAGVWLPALVSAPGIWTAVEAALFAALCFWNCVAIEAWELPSGRLPRWHAVTRWMAPRLRGTAAGMALMGAAMFAVTHHPIAGAEASSAVLFLLLQRGSRRLSPDILRPAVDLALLTPVLF